MYDDHRDEERGVFVPPPLTDEESAGDPDAPDGLLPEEAGSEGGLRRLPIWIQESSKSFRWGWVPLPLRKAGRAVVRWVKGPEPPHELLFRPLFPNIQALPVTYFERLFPKRKQKIAVLLFLYFSWFLSWFLVLLHSASSGYIEGYGRPQTLSCSASFWYGKPQSPQTILCPGREFGGTNRRLSDTGPMAINAASTEMTVVHFPNRHWPSAAQQIVER